MKSEKEKALDLIQKKERYIGRLQERMKAVRKEIDELRVVVRT